MKRFFCLSILIFLEHLCAEPLLIYNQYPRIWNMDFEKMTSYVPKIKKLGFNVIWVNPFFQSSDTTVKRFNKFTGEELDVKGSLYAMKLDESCQPNLLAPKEAIMAYTSSIKEVGIIPIFDLVLNHAAKDSPLIKKFPSWFKGQDGHWDDICPFNYTEENRSNIFESLWRPLLDQMVELGFQGMRVDYGTDVDQLTLKMCVEHLRTKVKNPLVVFGEALIPVEKNVKGVLDSCKGSGFTHLTNLSVFLSKKQILQGKASTNPLGYQWFLNDLGLKKSTCFRNCGNFWTGTIGFSGSHDHGTTILSYFLNQGVVQADIDERFLKEEIQEDIGKQLKCIRGQLIQERLNSITTTQKLEIVKEHMAIAAFSSDAGWYCFSSDEWLSEVAKSPFVRLEGTPFHKEEVVPNTGNAAIENFIQGINSTFLMLRQAPDTFWVEIFYADDGSHLIFVRHLSEEQLPADIVWVKIKEDAKDCNKDAVTHILSERHAELTSFNDVNFFYLK